MKLKRNNEAGIGKYAVVNLQKATIPINNHEDIIKAIQMDPSIVEIGEPGSLEEFFVLRLKDRSSEEALRAYMKACWFTDTELAKEVCVLANRAGKFSPYCKDPD